MSVDPSRWNPLHRSAPLEDRHLTDLLSPSDQRYPPIEYEAERVTHYSLTAGSDGPLFRTQAEAGIYVDESEISINSRMESFDDG